MSLYTTGYFNSIHEIGNQIIGTSNTGSVVRIQDIAEVKRELKEPTSNIAINGHKAMLIAIQMNEGNVITSYSIHYTKLYDDKPSKYR